MNNGWSKFGTLAIIFLFVVLAAFVLAASMMGDGDETD